MLRQNDPDETEFYIALRRSSDAELSEALRANEHIKKILFDFGNIRNTNSNSMLRVIAAYAILEKVTLVDSWESERINSHSDGVFWELTTIRYFHSFLSG